MWSALGLGVNLPRRSRPLLEQRGTTVASESRRRWGRLRPAASDEADGEYGSFYQSEMVLEEATNIMKDYEQIMKLMPKFAAFDTDGKRIFVDKMDDLCERIRISEMRAKLSNDPAVKGQLTTTNRQLLYMNTNMEAINAGMVDQCRQLRAIVEAETQISNPQELMEFRSMLAAAMSEESRMLETMAQALTPEKMTQHPEVMELLAKHPLAVKAIEDVVQGGAAAAEKYRDDPALHTALVLLFDL